MNRHLPLLGRRAQNESVSVNGVFVKSWVDSDSSNDWLCLIHSLPHYHSNTNPARRERTKGVRNGLKIDKGCGFFFFFSNIFLSAKMKIWLLFLPSFPGSGPTASNHLVSLSTTTTTTQKA